MSDQFALIDPRGRSAGAALREATTFRALADAPAPHRRGGMRLALVAAVVVAVVVGLVAIARRDAAPVDDRDPSRLRYLVGDLPDGWSTVSRSEASAEAVDQLPGMYMSLYGTSGDPMAPVAIVRWSSPESADAHALAGSGFAGFAATTELQEFKVGEWKAACGLDGGRARCLVETDRGFVQVAARGLTVDEARAMVTGLEFVADVPQIAPDRIPGVMSLLYQGPLGAYFTAGSASQRSSATVSMAGPQSGQATLTVSFTDDTDIAYLGLDEGWTSSTVAGRPAFRQAVHAGDETIVWVEGDRTFWLNTVNADDAITAAMAASVRPASASEWAAVPTLPTADSSEATVAPVGTELVGESAETVPSPTIDPTATIRDVEVTMDVVPKSDHTVDVTAVDADGSKRLTVTMSYVVDTYEVRGPEGGGSISRSPLKDTMLQFTPTNDAFGLFAIAEDPAATELVVLAHDGTRYRAALQSVIPGAPGRFAMVRLLNASFVSAQVLAADGTVLTEIPGGF